MSFTFPNSVRPEVDQIIKLIAWANLQDCNRNEVAQPSFPKLANQQGCYGHLQNALLCIISECTSPAVSVLVASELGQVFSGHPGLWEVEDCVSMALALLTDTQTR